MRLVEERAEYLLDPHNHLLARYLARGGTALTCSGRRPRLLSHRAVPGLGKAVKGERDAVCLHFYDGAKYSESKSSGAHTPGEETPMNEFQLILMNYLARQSMSFSELAQRVGYDSLLFE